MRFLALFTRNFKETYRDPLALVFLLGFPLIFMLLMGLAFGGETTPTFPVGVVDQDKTPVSQAFVSEALAEVKALEISSYDDPQEALKDLKLGDLKAYIIIPQGFGNQVNQTWQGMATNITLNITYDESDIMVTEQVVSIIGATTRSFAKIEVPITLNSSPIHIETKITYIDFIGPGIIIFGLLILIPNSARAMVGDKEKGFLARLQTTPVRPSEFILGYSLSFVVIAIVQIIIFVVLAHLFGMDIVGSIWLALLIFFLTSLCCISIGMIVSSLTKTVNQAEGFCWFISMPLAMLSGCWFSIELMPSYLRSIAYVFPFAHAIDASRGILTRGVGLGEVSIDVYWLIGWAVVSFATGVILFRRSMAR